MFSRLYEAVVDARNALYEKGMLKSFSLGVKTVSVGNITVGGTGKTPLVRLVAEILAARGERVCVLTRGYGRENAKKRVLVSDGERVLANVREAGDEPFELAGKLLGQAMIVADADRVAAGTWARGEFGVTAFVLDDAFQHRRVRRDSDIVCVDATNPFGGGRLLPGGILREPLRNLKRADAIVVTRANLAEDISNLESQISKYNSRCPIFVTRNKVSNLVELEKFLAANTQSIEITTDRRPPTADRCLAFCALGNPENFFAQLRRENYRLTATRAFPDHHFYTANDIEKLSNKARQNGAEVLLTTAKDAVKLKDLKIDLPCFVVESEMVFDEENEFRKWILEARTEK